VILAGRINDRVMGGYPQHPIPIVAYLYTVSMSYHSHNIQTPQRFGRAQPLSGPAHINSMAGPPCHNQVAGHQSGRRGEVDRQLPRILWITTTGDRWWKRLGIRL
jgi:hypothetical protein